MDPLSLSSEALRGRIRAIDRAIERYDVLAELAATVGGRHSQRSDRGWLVSMLTLEAGTLMAVLSGRRARGWNDVIRALNAKILRLQIGRTVVEHELRQHLDDRL